MFFVEKRREAVAHHRVVVVEPCILIMVEQTEVGRSEVDGIERERLELQERAKLRRRVRRDKERVLLIHSEYPFQIDAQFVGDCQALLERCRVPLHTNRVRTYVHVKVNPTPLDLLLLLHYFLIYHSKIALQNDTLIGNTSVSFLITLQNEDFKVKQS